MKSVCMVWGGVHVKMGSEIRVSFGGGGGGICFPLALACAPLDMLRIHVNQL